MGGRSGKRSRNRAPAAASGAFDRTKPEVTGVLLLLFGTFFCLSLASYDGIGPDGLPAGTNLMGVAGRYAAFVSLQVFGLTAGYYVAMALVLGTIWLTSERDDVTSGVVLAYAVAGLLVAALAHLGTPSDVLLGGHLIGGAAGELIGTTLSAIFSPWGAWLVALGTIVLLVLVATPAALKEALLRIGRAARIIGRGVAACASPAVRAWHLAGETAAAHGERSERADVGGANADAGPPAAPP
ncbi:MAG: DNA translocase FtsK 4TM domain-containing protein, partial [Myxococcota bacterium]|nr:DNA translocase FtsK 4TM domain-containing protein [Myxococcota bacterium]